MSGVLLMVPCVGVKGSLGVCPLSPSSLPCNTVTFLPPPQPSRPLFSSWHAALELENNPWQQGSHLSPKSRGQMGIDRRSLCCKGHGSPGGCGCAS